MNPSKSPIGIAIIGCGAVAQLFYLPSLKELSGKRLIEVKALVDINAGSSSKLKKEFPGAQVYSDLERLNPQTVQLAVVASPNNLHCNQSIRLLNSKIAVLCEKPLALTSVQGQAMIDAATANNLPLAVGLYRRFLPACQKIKDILQQGALGKIINFHFREGGSFSWPLQSPSLFSKTQAGGGILLDIGSHVLDLLLWWLGQPAHIAYQDDALGGVEANCCLQLKYDNGVEGTIKLSRDWCYQSGYRIEGEKGYIFWNPEQSQNLQIVLHNSSEVVHEQALDYSISTSDFQDCFTAQLLNVIQALSGTAQLKIPAAQALLSLDLIEKCYQNKTLLCLPWLTQNELEAARRLSRQVGSC